MNNQAGELSEMLSNYSARKRASGASVRVYERGNIFRLYISADKAKAIGLDASLLNKQGFISLNKLSASERERVRVRVSELVA